MKTYHVKNLYSDGKKSQFKSIQIENGIIKSINDCSPDTKFDFDNLAPALVDIHINGGEKFHFTAKPDYQTLEDIENANFENGVGYCLPTVITSSFENIKKGINAVKEFNKHKTNSGILGMHLEGPFLSEKKRGAHLTKYLQKPNTPLINQIINEGKGIIKLLTIAPELFEKQQLQILANSGINVALGHSDCTFEIATQAFESGITMVTHLYNAMSGFEHRKPGLVGAALYNDQIYTPVILDNIHLKKEVAEISYKLKGQKLILISDALFLNRKIREFKWEEFDIEVINGEYYNKDGNLAGASISLADAVKNARNWFKIPAETALEMATNIPAKALKLERKIGSILPEYEAKFCTFDNELNNFRGIF